MISDPLEIDRSITLFVVHGTAGSPGAVDSSIVPGIKIVPLRFVLEKHAHYVQFQQSAVKFRGRSREKKKSAAIDPWTPEHVTMFSRRGFSSNDADSSLAPERFKKRLQAEN